MSNETDNKTEYIEYKLTTKDPLGREVKLKDTTWQMHISGGDHEERKELVDQEHVIESVLSNPYIILPNDPANPDDKREKYVDMVMLPNTSTIRSLVVVVDHSSPDFGDVVTAISKKTMNQEKTTGGYIYVRTQSTGPK